MNKALVMRLTLFKDSEKSFIEALDANNIEHGSAQTFSREPQASGNIELVTAISEAMPWNSLAKVIIEWIKARKSREIIITTEDNKIFHAKGYSVKEVEKILSISVNVTVIDTNKHNKNIKATR